MSPPSLPPAPAPGKTRIGAALFNADHTRLGDELRRAEAGADLVFLPAEHTPLVYESSYRVRELGMRAGICLALGTPLEVLGAALPLVDAALLLGRVTGEGSRGRDFNRIALDRIRGARAMIDRLGLAVDLQAAGGLEMESCAEACLAGATSLPVGAALYREPDMRAMVAGLRERIASAISKIGG